MFAAPKTADDSKVSIELSRYIFVSILISELLRVRIRRGRKGCFGRCRTGCSRIPRIALHHGRPISHDISQLGHAVAVAVADKEARSRMQIGELTRDFLEV